MKGPAVIGLVLLAVGGWFLFTTPGNVTWGNHHYLKHLVSYGCLGVNTTVAGNSLAAPMNGTSISTSSVPSTT